MVKAPEAALCMAAAAAAGCWVAAPSPGFLISRPGTTSPEAAVPQARASTLSFDAPGCSMAPLAVAGMVGAAAVAAQRRARTAARATAPQSSIAKYQDGMLATKTPEVDTENTFINEGLDYIDPSITPQTAPVTGDILKVSSFAGGMVGHQYAGFGEYKWDPCGLSRRWPEHLPWYREAELKHGRVCMLAFVGLVVPEFVRIPMADFEGEFDFTTTHNQLIYGIGLGPMWWLLFFCGVVESLRFKDLGFDFGKLTCENAGDLNFGKQFMPKTADGQLQMKIKELKNGRLAMMAVSGIITQGALFDNHHFPWTATFSS